MTSIFSLFIISHFGAVIASLTEKTRTGRFEGVDAGFAMGGSVWYSMLPKILAF